MKPIAIFYEHADWFKPLFAELERRNIPYVRIDAASHKFPLHGEESPYSLIFNRCSPSAFLRGHQQSIFYTLDWLTAMESLGTKVINGTRVYSYEISKARQLVLLKKLGIDFPKAWVINSAAAALEAAEDLRFPVVVKANIGGSGAGIVRYDSMDALATAVHAGSVELGIDGTALVQELAPLRGGHIVRIEIMNGEYLYAIKVFPAQGSFDLCPADACETMSGHELVRAACAVDAPKRGLKVEGYKAPDAMIDVALKIAMEKPMSTISTRSPTLSPMRRMLLALIPLSNSSIICSGKRKKILNKKEP
jgi:hypothetical protein